MLRQKASDNLPPPPMPGCWLAGALIGSAILTMVTGAVMLGVGAALQDATLPGARRPPR